MDESGATTSLWVGLSEPVAGLSLLLQAVDLAMDVERSIWDFAIDLATLKAAGVNSSDLRWFICKGFVEHAYEVTEPTDTKRRFTPGGELLFGPQSCFVLTDKGQLYARQTAPSHNGNGHSKTSVHVSSADEPAAQESVEGIANPTWDAGRHQLRVGSVIVKEYKLHSPNQETILASFQEEDWPPCIDDPLPVHPDIDPKRRLHDTIKSLNRNQRRRLIRFMGDGSGEGVRWEWSQRKSLPEIAVPNPVPWRAAR